MVFRLPWMFRSVRRIAAEPDRLVRERATLRERLLASPIGDTRRYIRAVEDVYQELWRRCCDESVTTR